MNTLIFRANVGSLECAVSNNIGFYRLCGLYSESRYIEIGCGMQICDIIPTLNFATHLETVLLHTEERETVSVNEVLSVHANISVI
jgi:hypothetical protein